MMSSGELDFYLDMMLVENILGDSRFHKKAGVVSEVLDKMKEYFASNINQNHPTDSVMDLLAPGALWLTLRALGLGKWGLLLGLLMDVFHVDVHSILYSIWAEVKQLLASGGKVSSHQIDAIVNNTIQNHNTPATPAEAQEGYQVLQQNPKLQEGEQVLDTQQAYSSLDLLNSVRFINLAMIDYEDQNMRLTKNAGWFDKYNGRKAQGTSLLAKIFGFVFKIALASAGLMVAGDLINKYILGRPNAIDQTYQAGKGEVEAPSAAPMSRSTQTKFPAKGDSVLPRSWPLMNNVSNIENMLVQFAKDTYSGLDGKESLIINSPAFQAVKEQIDWFNIHNKGSAAIFLPPNFTSKKQVVDLFIDDVAKATG